MKYIISFINRAATRHYPVIIFILAFIDSFVFATPVTSVFILLLTRREVKPGKSILTVLSGVLAGAAAGYVLGYTVLIRGEDWLTASVQNIMDSNTGFSVGLYYKIRSLFLSNGLIVMLTGAFTPVPYGMFSIAAGLLKINVFWFLIVTLTGHGIKYLLIAFIMERLRKNIPGRFSSWTKKLADSISKTRLAEKSQILLESVKEPDTGISGQTEQCRQL